MGRFKSGGVNGVVSSVNLVRSRRSRKEVKASSISTACVA